MALDFFWLEDRTATTQRVSFRCTADHAAVGVSGNTVAVATATKDGTGYVDIAATADAGTATLLVDGVPSGTINYPAFAASTDTFTMGVAGCQSQDYEFLAGHWLKKDCSLVVQTGDWIYEGEAYNQWGETGMASCLVTPTAANWFKHHRQPHRNPGWKVLGHSVPIYKIEDDHDVIDKYDQTDQAAMATAITAYVAANGGTRADALTAITGFAFGAIEAYRHQNPYYAFTFGAARIIVPNLMKYTDPLTKAAGPTKTKMGATQLAWFLGELADPSPIKVVISSKVLFNGPNDDGWYPWPNDPVTYPGFTDELSTILKHIKTNAIKGVIWMTGDSHHPMVQNLTPQMVATKLGIGTAADYDHVVMFNATPSGKIQDHNVTAGPADGVIWKKQSDGVASGLHRDAVVAKLVISPAECQAEMWTISGQRIGYGIIDAGSNQMRHGWFVDD